MSRRPLLLAALLLAAPATASAQSLFNAAGLGLPATPGDARSRALGGLGLGLQGTTLSGSDPAAAADFVMPAAILTAQPSWVDFGRSDGTESGTFKGTRFPSVGIAYPAWYGIVATLSLETVLDQRYEAESASTVDFGGTPVEVSDAFVSTGGVSQIRLGLARRLSPRLAVGLSAGRLSGSVTRRLVRSFGEGVDTTTVRAGAPSSRAASSTSSRGTSVSGSNATKVPGTRISAGRRAYRSRDSERQRNARGSKRRAKSCPRASRYSSTGKRAGTPAAASGVKRSPSSRAERYETMPSPLANARASASRPVSCPSRTMRRWRPSVEPNQHLDF